MNVLGIDLSLNCTGIAKVTSGTYRTMPIKRPSGQREWPELRRLRWMVAKVAYEVEQPLVQPWDLVVIEGLAYSRTTGQAMARAGLWWLVVDRIDAFGTPCAVMTPTCRAKYATGKGNAGKDAVMLAVARRFPDFVGGEDEADAMVLAAAGADHLGQPVAELPKLNRDALAAVDWPGVPADAL